MQPAHVNITLFPTGWIIRDWNNCLEGIAVREVVFIDRFSKGVDIVALHYANLDDRTRDLMRKEVDFDISRGTLYISPFLNERGRQKYPSLLKEAIQIHDDGWLANAFRLFDLINLLEEKRKPTGGITTEKVPITAPDTLAEGEFNRFYVRGLCLIAIEDGIPEVEIYRGKVVNRPRLESEIMIFKRLPAKSLLDDIRKSSGVEPALGLPPGPNSGLTARLPKN